MQLSKPNIRQFRLSLTFLGLSISAVSILILGLLNRFSVFEYQQSEVGKVADVATLTFQNNIETYIYTLFGARGFLYSSTQPTRHEFNQFITSLDLPRRLPGTTALGYAKLVKETERNEFITEVRNDTSLDKGGYPEFEIHPVLPSSLALVATYVEPSNLSSSQAILGFNLFSDSGRKQAFELSRDSNRAMMTSTVAAAAADREAFVLILPVYDQSKRIVSIEDRQQAVTGAVVMSLMRTELFNSSFDVFLDRNPSLRIKVYEGSAVSDDFLVYDSNMDKQVLGISCCETKAIETRTFERAGRTWIIEFSLPQQRSALAVPYPIMAVPLILIILLSTFGLAMSLKLVRPS